MMKRLLTQIALMCLILALGFFNLIFSILASIWWVSLIALISVAFAFYAAFLSYLTARRIADVIDGYMDSTDEQLKGHLDLFKIIFKDEEKPKGDN